MKIDRIVVSGGNGDISVDAVLLRSSVTPTDNSLVSFIEDLYYAQNRLFIRRFRDEYFVGEDGEWQETITLDDDIPLCDYVVIPDYDLLLGQADSE